MSLGTEKVIGPTPALGFSIQVDLGAGRTGVLQTALPNDCSLGELNGMLDKMNSASDRLRAHYKIEERERDIEMLQNEQAQHDEDLGKVDERFATDQEKLKTQLLEQEAARTNFVAAKEEAHRESGRRGNYEAKGVDKSQLAGVASNVEKTKEMLARNKAEHDITHEKHADLKQRRADLVAKHQREIDKCRQVMARGLEAAV